MKKALQDGNCFFHIRNGQVHMSSHADVAFLTQCANKFLKTDGIEGCTSIEEYGLSLSLQKWLGRLVAEGRTEKLINDLNQTLNKVRFLHILMPSRRGLPSWEYVADMNPGIPEQVAAYRFSQHLAAGDLEGLKRCRLKNCERFFVGRPDGKWCSKACGSKYRVSKKRRIDGQSVRL